MRTQIITIHHTQNLGGCLQAIALQEVVKRYDENVELIDYRPKVITDIYSGFSVGKYYRTLKKGYIGQTVRMIGSDLKHLKRNNAILRKFQQFHKKYYRLTSSQYYTLNQLKHAYEESDVDVLITGSDQVWNSILFGDYDQAYFLRFGKSDVYRFSYAASIGRDEVSSQDLQLFSDLLKDYNAISVREANAQSILKKIIEREVNVVLDPTLLMSGDEWLTLFDQGVDIPKEEYIFVYTINWSDDVVRFANKLSKEKGVPVVSIYGHKIFDYELINYPMCTPDDFVRLVSGAKYVVTNSFHGTVFSVIFKKEFWTFLNKDRNSRMEDLTKLLGISDRLVELGKEGDVKLNGIDYASVMQLLEDRRRESIEFIAKQIDEAKNEEKNTICFRQP